MCLTRSDLAIYEVFVIVACTHTSTCEYIIHAPRLAPCTTPTVGWERGSHSFAFSCCAATNEAQYRSIPSTMLSFLGRQPVRAVRSEGWALSVDTHAPSNAFEASRSLYPFAPDTRTRASRMSVRRSVWGLEGRKVCPLARWPWELASRQASYQVRTSSAARSWRGRWPLTTSATAR